MEICLGNIFIKNINDLEQEGALHNCIQGPEFLCCYIYVYNLSRTRELQFIRNILKNYV